MMTIILFLSNLTITNDEMIKVPFVLLVFVRSLYLTKASALIAYILVLLANTNCVRYCFIWLVYITFFLYSILFHKITAIDIKKMLKNMLITLPLCNRDIINKVQVPEINQSIFKSRIWYLVISYKIKCYFKNLCYQGSWPCYLLCGGDVSSKRRGHWVAPHALLYSGQLILPGVSFQWESAHRCLRDITASVLT